MKSKDIALKPTELKLSDNTITKGTLILDVVNTEGAHFEVTEAKPHGTKLDSQMWKKSNDKPFFTLTNKMKAQVLTATPNGLEIKGMYLKLFKIEYLQNK